MTALFAKWKSMVIDAAERRVVDMTDDKARVRFKARVLYALQRADDELADAARAAKGTRPPS